MAAPDPVYSLLHLLALPPTTAVVFVGDGGYPTCASCAAIQCSVPDSMASRVMENGGLRLALTSRTEHRTCWLCKVRVTMFKGDADGCVDSTDPAT